jgi:flavin reductase (DIM6/NTAB) family NADH-FMN oxidoreductase RutF
MSNDFVEIKPEEITGNTFKLFGSDWPIITAGTLNKFNSMTAGWGGFGVIWCKKVAAIAVRPQRFTYQFLARESDFSLSFFSEKYKDALNYFGSHSGKDVDKAKETGVTPLEFDGKVVYYKEADLVIILKKIYFHDIDPKNFIDLKPEEFYPGNDYHRLYIGEISKILIKK